MRPLSLTFELFATGAMSPDALWAVVGDPGRLPEWTDAEAVRGPGRPLEEGDEVGVTVGGTPMTWTVVTVGERIWEAQAATSAGVLGLGARVVGDASGSRLILAGSLEPSGSALVARLLTLPRLRSRCDHWTADALRLARQGR